MLYREARKTMVEVETVLEIARKELGYTESPPKSNRTKYGKWYGLDGNPWCMMFVMWCFYQAGALYLLPKKTASCGELRKAARQAGRWVTGEYQPGDILIYDFPKTGVETDHTGLAERIHRNSVTGEIVSVTAIEGNTGVGNDANGGQVMRRTRKVSLILGAVRPAWDKSGVSNGAALYDMAGDAAQIEEEVSEEWGGADDVPAENGNAGAETGIDTDRVKDVAYIAEITVNTFLNIRRGPGTEYGVLTTLHKGDIVAVIAEYDGWGQIPTGGWIKLEFTARR